MFVERLLSPAILVILAILSLLERPKRVVEAVRKFERQGRMSDHCVSTVDRRSGEGRRRKGLRAERGGGNRFAEQKVATCQIASGDGDHRSDAKCGSRER